jgi:hypothetical protein
VVVVLDVATVVELPIVVEVLDDPGGAGSVLGGVVVVLEVDVDDDVLVDAVVDVVEVVAVVDDVVRAVVDVTRLRGRVVVVTVVVVVVVTQPTCVHESAQLGNRPMQAAPPFGAVQRPGLGLITHIVLSFFVVRQHVTAPGLPQVEMAAALIRRPRHSRDRWPLFIAVFATVVTHFMYRP